MRFKDTLRRWIYGEPLQFQTDPRLTEMHEQAVTAGRPIIVASKDEYWMVLCDLEFVSYLNQVPFVGRLFDEDGREYLGAFRDVQVWSTYIADGTEVDEAIERVKALLKI